ncbi:AAA family ATPase [Pelagicoccus mobilis]|uniref:AAA family ATPase n=1 Tax=Pelagicoccus mobilis TaxID=415221 RepID=A0A934VRI6_9BACT|nr:AAA family ATPase [Pelagicoccus mobilis]MBK1877985.1 AAA family ATPase [Pelagicoccus mobilis]
MTTDLIEIWKEIEDPDFHVAENQLHPSPKPFTVLNGSKLRSVPIPEKIDILGDGVISLGQLTTIIGQGGTGKSRVTMQIALSQILGWSMAGLKTHPEPLKHLLIGTENSIYRQKSEYQKMTQSLSPEQREQVDAHMFFHVVQEMDDAFIHLGSDDIRKKWVDTFEIVNPDVVYIDPYGEVHVGDINKDADVRHTLREITKVCRRFNPRTSIVIVHHGRTGRANIAQAVGWDKGNYALGSKALYSGARSQINIAPADPDDASRIIFSCGKSNDAKPFDPVGLKLDDTTMLYGIDAAFDLQAWKADVEGKRNQTNFTIAEALQAIQSGASNVRKIHQKLGGSEAGSKRSLERILAKAKSEGYFRFGKKGYFLTKKGKDVLAQVTEE